MGIFKTLGVLTIALFLQGCYLTDIQVLSSGERVPISGQITCESALLGDVPNKTVREVSSGVPFFRTYEYHINSEVTLFSRINNNLYLAQTALDETRAREMGGKYLFSYYDFSSSDSYSVMLPDMEDAAPLLSAMARGHGLTATSTPESLGMFVKLSGSPQNLEAFLKTDGLGMLVTIATCTRR